MPASSLFDTCRRDFLRTFSTAETNYLALRLALRLKGGIRPFSGLSFSIRSD